MSWALCGGADCASPGRTDERGGSCRDSGGDQPAVQQRASGQLADRDAYRSTDTHLKQRWPPRHTANVWARLQLGEVPVCDVKLMCDVTL